MCVGPVKCSAFVSQVVKRFIDGKEETLNVHSNTEASSQKNLMLTIK